MRHEDENVERPRLTNQISIGNILQAASLLLAAAVGYAYVDARSTSNSTAIGRLEAMASSTEVRVRVLENSQARADERYSALLAIMERMDARLERIERRGEP